MREMIDFQKYNNLGLRGGGCLWSDWHWSRHRFFFMHTVGWAKLGSEYVQPGNSLYPEWGVELEYF